MFAVVQSKPATPAVFLVVVGGGRDGAALLTALAGVSTNMPNDGRITNNFWWSTRVRS